MIETSARLIVAGPTAIAPAGFRKGCLGIRAALSAILYCAAPVAVFGGDADPTTAPANSTVVGENGGTLEEVIVSARRRDEDLQRVPISIASLSAEDLQIRGIDSVEQLDHTIPNFSPAPYNFFGTEQASFRMRGLPSVGV